MNVRDAIKHNVCRAFAPLGLALVLAPSPGAHAAEQLPLAPLKYFVGHWICAGRFANGKPVQSHDQVSSELAGHWLRVRHAEDPPARWRADEWWGYDKATTNFTINLFDNFDNPRHYLSSGWVGNVLTLENTAVKGFIDRFVFERRSGTEYRVVYSYRKDAGAWHVGDEQVCKRERLVQSSQVQAADEHRRLDSSGIPDTRDRLSRKECLPPPSDAARTKFK